MNSKKVIKSFSKSLEQSLEGEIIDIWTWVGAAIIFASSIYIARREAMLNKQTLLQQTPRTPGL